MKTATLLFLLVFGGITAAAQNQPAGQADCDKEELKSQPGKWLPQPGDEVHTNTRRPTAEEAGGAKKIFNQVGKLFQEKYKPVGVDVYNYLTYDISPIGSAYGNSYIYTISNFRFLCINGKRSRNSEGVSSSVYINPGGALTVNFSEIPIYDYRGEVNSEATNRGGFHSLSSKECKGGKLPDLSNGYHIVEGAQDYYVWITYEGKLPFRYVSRKEFLEKQVVLLEAQRKERKPGDSKDFLSMFFEKPLEAYRQDLKKDSAWLNETAVINHGSITDPATKKHLYSRYTFTKAIDGSTSVPIMPNPAYYNRSLPKWAPQFMVINVGRTDGFIGQNIRKVVDENISFFTSILANQ
ncbi:MAG: hypothetical protein KF862_05595 [Chitinophagaceae bacterium]|nr:hypothetical protein [Chitinophagaceae bacterium]